MFESLTPATGERQSDIGVSLTVKLKRGTGTRDQDEVIAKAKGKTLEDAREDMQTLREYIHGLTDDARQIQPADPHWRRCSHSLSLRRMIDCLIRNQNIMVQTIIVCPLTSEHICISRDDWEYGPVCQP